MTNVSITDPTSPNIIIKRGEMGDSSSIEVVRSSKEADNTDGPSNQSV